MSDWSVTFANASLVPWVGAIWGELPDAGLTPVSWRQARVLPGGTADFSWNDEYSVVLGSYAETLPSGIYTITTERTAKPNSTWDAITINEFDYLAEDQQGGGEGPIQISNRSAGPVNAGLARTGAALAYFPDLAVDAQVTFTLTPQFRFGLFADLEAGQVIEPLLVTVGPQPLTFPEGVHKLLVTAVLQGTTVVLTVVPAG